MLNPTVPILWVTKDWNVLCTGVVQPLEVMGRQEIQQQSAVEINLTEMSPFISDVSQSQLQPQVCERSSSVIYSKLQNANMCQKADG